MSHELAPRAESYLDEVKGGSKKNNIEPITKTQDNALQRRAEQLLAAKAFKLTGDGQMPFSLKAEEKVRHNHSTPIEDAREKLQQTAKSLRESNKMSPEDLLEFEENLKKINDRVEHGYVSADEVRNLYKQTETLVSTEKAVVSERNRILLAENILGHAARPHDIDQGCYNTCQMTAVGERLFTHNPSKAAELITTAALYGKFVSQGKTITIDGASLWPQPESLHSHPTPPARSYATQVLNVLLVNDVTQREVPPKFYHQLPAGHIDTTDSTGDATHRARKKDNGERLTDAAEGGNEIYAHDAHGKIIGFERSPGSASFVVNVAAEIHRITKESDVMIGNDDTEPPTPGLLRPRKQEELEHIFTRHKMPMLICVDARNPPFNIKSSSPAGHMLTVQSYDAATQKAHLSNQWGPKFDQTVSLNTLYQATLVKSEPKASTPSHH